LSYSLGVITPDDLFEAYNVGANVDDFPHLAQKLGGSRALELNVHAEREAARITG
jgi:hypothetical protein